MKLHSNVRKMLFEKAKTLWNVAVAMLLVKQLISDQEIT